LVPRRIKEPSDFRPGTKKGKIDAHPIWTVTIDMPKTLMQDIDIGRQHQEHQRMAELMKYSQAPMKVSAAGQEGSADAPDQT
jgi:hypothetical protein